ncbi:MAG: hypothetical protein ACOZCO_14425 [Bacteroidota bacterium]
MARAVTFPKERAAVHTKHFFKGKKFLALYALLLPSHATTQASAGKAVFSAARQYKKTRQSKTTVFYSV